MKEVLVLGGTQFFGKRLVELLLNENIAVTIATRGLTADPFGDKVERLTIDREDRLSLQKAFEGRKWDVVYDQSCLSPQEVKDAADALKGKVNRYIFTSTMAVYEYGEKHVEEDFNPFYFNFEFKTRREYPGYLGYQEAKRAAEAYLFQETSFEVAAVRFPLVIGQDDYTNRLKFHVDRVFDSKPIGIKNPGTRYSFIKSDEAAKFLLDLGGNSFVGPINPGCQDDISLKELLEKIEVLTGGRLVLVSELSRENASPYGMDDSWSISTEKVTGLGFQFSDLNETLNDLIRYYMSVEVK
jgi:nucleoside-diphosphate-sugar epimerase